MGRKNKRQKIETFVIPKDLIMLAEKPRYNAHQGGYGPHKNKKAYTRKDKHKGKVDYN